MKNSDIFLGLCTFACLTLKNLCYSSPESPTDVFKSPCARISDTHFVNNGYQGYSLWSSPLTWPNRKVPGVGTQIGVDAVIPCGKSVVLDVKNVNLGLLQIKGLLRVLDDPTKPSIYIKANYVLVEGQLNIGTPTRHFTQKVTFELTPNTKRGRAELNFTSFAPATAKHPRLLGHKAFVVVGGQVQLYGMPGGTDTITFAKLAQTAKAGQTTIVVNTQKAAKWPVGSEIAIASTDFDWRQAERFKITKVREKTTKQTIFTLDRKLEYLHFGDPLGLPDGFGGYVDECAEVAMLTRNIVIRGTKEAAPYHLEGGHFMIFMTRLRQRIEGVEFVNMGQQGILGRYPVHFHILGKVPTNTCRKISVHDSNQRCFVLHATDSMRVEDNVAVDTFGHCYMVEEGGEQGNVFKNNLGMSTQPVTVKISDDESDDRPATFWISNARNTYVLNVAAGGDNAGFWIEHRFAVRGASVNILRIADILPFRLTLLRFSYNTAHSYRFAGLRTYPSGWRPRSENGTKLKAGTMDNILLYKNSLNGAFIHITEQLTFKDSTFADNGVGIFMSRVIGNVISNCRIIGQTLNYGNPSKCDQKASSYTTCKPISGCSMPVASNSLGRTTGGLEFNDPIFGIQIETYETVDTYALPIRIENSKFSKFGSPCVRQSAIMTFGKGNLWCPPQLTNLKFDNETIPVYLPSKSFKYQALDRVIESGEQGNFLSVWAKDSSISALGAGFLVANNNPAVLPASYTKVCKFNTAMNAHVCPNLCYRTVAIIYDEPGWSKNKNVTKLKRGDVSRLQISRSDGLAMTLDGNMNDEKAAGISPDERFFSMTVPSGITYKVVVVPPTKKTSFYPDSISIRYFDEGGCGKFVTLQIKPKANNLLTIETSDVLSYKTCAGTASAPTDVAQFSYTCVSGQSWANIFLGGSFSDTAVLTRSGRSTSCSSDVYCTLMWNRSPRWLYDTSGKELRPSFYNPSTPTTGWKTGTAPFGYDFYDSPIIATLVPAPSKNLITYYFRSSFEVKDFTCFSSLLVDVLVKDGVVLYLNNVEILRINMPTGTITTSTLATPEEKEPLNTWYQSSVALSATKYLVEGTNYIAVETHVLTDSAFQIAFDLGISGKRKTACSGVKKSPEVCDGIDNDNDGLVDKKPNGSPLTRPCSTKCGTGVATCINGTFQKCTAKMPQTEICNGKDDNCDGLIDNGLNQLNCGSGVCYQGTCLPSLNGTKPVQVWPRQAPSWSYYDVGGDLNATLPTWKTGNGYETWKRGKAPLGYDEMGLPWNKFGTKVNRFTTDRISRTGYFVKAFLLTKAEKANTFAMDFSIRRIDGAVVFLNGVEIHRSNMPTGAVKYDTAAKYFTKENETSPGCCNLQWLYYPCDKCYHKTAAPLKVGINKIAVELHTAGTSRKTALLDMDLYRKAYTACSDIPGKPQKCVREVKGILIGAATSWLYADARISLPPSNWMLPAFTASNWKKGQAPLGFGKTRFKFNTNLYPGSNKSNPRQTFYFRKIIQVPDAACYVRMNSSLLARDGAIMYINGVETFRDNMPAGRANSTLSAVEFGGKDYVDRTLSGGWLQKGTNVVAVEVHRHRSNIASVVFDMEISGYREAISCSVAPGPTTQSVGSF